MNTKLLKVSLSVTALCAGLAFAAQAMEVVVTNPVLSVSQNINRTIQKLKTDVEGDVTTLTNTTSVNATSITNITNDLSNNYYDKGEVDSKFTAHKNSTTDHDGKYAKASHGDHSLLHSNSKDHTHQNPGVAPYYDNGHKHSYVHSHTHGYSLTTHTHASAAHSHSLPSITTYVGSSTCPGAVPVKVFTIWGLSEGTVIGCASSW